MAPPPSREPGPAAGGPALPSAPLSRRAAARVLDVVLLGWLVAVVVVELGARLFGGDVWARRPVEVDADAAGTILLVAACILLVEVLPVAITGRTLGKAMAGLAVVDREGFRPPWLAALLRAIVIYGAALGLPAVLGPVAAVLAVSVVLSPARRGLHDRVAGTRVVAMSPGPGPGT